MKLKLSIAILLLSAVAFCQTAPKVQTYSLNLSAVSLPGNNQTVAGTAGGFNLNVTPNNAVGLYSILSPGQNFQYYAGRYNYVFQALSNKLNNLGPVNFLKFQFGATASTGMDRITTTGAQHYAYSGGGFVNYSMDSGGHYSLGVELQYARFPGLKQNAFIVALDPAIHF